ncbi:MAG: tetratricopeptide repeat protein [Candidatus Sumerlaeia bacterium]|nr:tetratricopeptide repeat protein [Candidatus Sumerlaeia bacterium]
MTTLSPTGLARKINALLDGLAFLDHWKERFRNSQSFGATLKSLCPFHPGESFRSFLLDLKTKTYRCTVNSCPASAGGTFADLHALLTGKTPLESLLDLCAVFHLRLPDDLRYEMTETLADEARSLMARGQMDAAENLAGLAFQQEPTNPNFLHLLAEICDARQRPDQARSHYEHALEQAIAEQDWARAATLLDRLRTTYPDEPLFLERSVEVARAQNDLPLAVSCCLELAKHPDLTPEQQCRWLEQVRALEPDRPEILQPLASLYDQTGRDEQAVEVRLALVEFYHNSGQWRKALDVLEEVIRSCPNREDLAAKQVELLLAGRLNDEAAALLQRLTDQAVEKGDTPGAERYLLRLCEVCPADAEPCRRLLALLVQTGRTEDAAQIAEKLLALCDPETAGERYAAMLEQLTQWDPDNPAAWGRLITHYARWGDSEAALRCLRESVEWYFRQGKKEDALQRIQTMRSLAVDHPRQQLELARLLAAHDCTTEALHEFEAVARECLNSDPALAEEACTAGLQLDPGNTALEEALLHLSLADNRAGTVERGIQLAERYRAAGMLDRGLAVLERLKQRLPGEIRPRLLLAAWTAEAGSLERGVTELCDAAEGDLSADQAEQVIEAVRAWMARHGSRPQLLPVMARLHRIRHDDAALVETLLQIAAAQRSSGMAAAAEATYAEILSICPDEVSAMLGRAELVYARRGFVEAKPLFLSAIARMHALGRLDEAAAICTQCLQWVSGDVDIRRRLAALLAEQGKLAEACEQWEAAAACCLKVHGDPSAALECYEELEKLQPDNPRVLEKIEHARAIQKEREQSAGRMQKAGEPTESSISATEDTSRAFGLFVQALEADPENLDVRESWVQFLYDHNRIEEGHQALKELVDLLVRRGKSKKAIEWLSRSVERFPQAADLQTQLGDLYQAGRAAGRALAAYKKAFEIYRQSGDTAPARALAEKVLAADPLDVETRAWLADRLYDEGQIEAALRHSNILTAQYCERRLYDLAERECRRVVAHDPDNLAAWQKILEMVENLGEQTEHVSDYLLTANLLERQGLLDEAAQIYGRAVQLDPDNLQARRSLVDIYHQLGAVQEMASEALELGDRLTAQGQIEEALDCYLRVLAVQPNHPRAAEAVRQLGRSVTRTGGAAASQVRRRVESQEEAALREAIADYQKILRANPNTPLVRSQLGDLLLQLGDTDGAVLEWERAATEFADAGDFKQVEAVCAKILQINPNHAQAKERLSRVHVWKDSMDALDKAIRSLEES